MKNCHRFFFAVAFVSLATFAVADVFGGTPGTDHSSPKSAPVKAIEKRLRWNDPDAEKKWEAFIQKSDNFFNRPVMENVDITQAQGQLETFGTRYMPNAYAQYQEVRAKAMELRDTFMETFPKGSGSDPTGGTMFEKAGRKVVEAAARSCRRRDELCFFLLFHQAGIFSEDELAGYDSRPISIRLESESNAWPDDTPKAIAALSVEDSTFAAKYLPETFSGYQYLCGIFDEGAKQYAELRQTALALGAPRARWELSMLKNRLKEIQMILSNYKQDISRQRLEHAFGDTTAEQLATQDQKNAVKIQKYGQEMGVKAYVVRAATHLFVAIPGGVPMEMVWCPPGTFTMGSLEGNDNEKPQHQVTLTKGFWMGKTEVTQAQWKSVMGNNPSDNQGDNLPVENVSWDDCQEFCEKTGLQLPTEAQWEYACRAGSTGPYAGTGNLDEMGWYDSNSGHQTHPVETKQPNAWGLYDMHGNVWEWCADRYGDYPNGAVTDPQGSSSGSDRVRRGGSWHYNASDCSSSHRDDDFPSDADNDYGFRLVRNLSE